MLLRFVVAVKATFAIDAVECAYFSVGRHEVDSERYAETAAVDRSENRGGKEDCCHNEAKVQIKLQAGAAWLFYVGQVGGNINIFNFPLHFGVLKYKL